MDHYHISRPVEKLKDLMKDAALLGFDDDNSKHESIEVMAGSITDVRPLAPAAGPSQPSAR